MERSGERRERRALDVFIVAFGLRPNRGLVRKIVTERSPNRNGTVDGRI